jgi:hypothetical protein
MLACGVALLLLGFVAVSWANHRLHVGLAREQKHYLEALGLQQTYPDPDDPWMTPRDGGASWRLIERLMVRMRMAADASPSSRRWRRVLQLGLALLTLGGLMCAFDQLNQESIARGPTEIESMHRETATP